MDKERAEREVDPVVEAYKPGIDRTLLRERLKRTVTERFLDLMALQEFVDEMHRAGRAAKLIRR